MDIVVLTGLYTLADGTTPARGTLTFRLSSPLLDAEGNQIATTKEITATLINGAFSQPLVATNTPGFQPSGVTYIVNLRLAPNYSTSFEIEIPYDAPGGTIDMADLTPVSGSTVTYGVTLQAFDAFKAQTTNVHGIADTSLLETTTGAQAKADAAQAAAASGLAAHEADTTGVHGIPDTAQLARTDSAQTITGAWDFTGGLTQNGATISGKRVSRVSVAAANALSKHIQAADFVCDGVNDGSTINAALAEMASRRGAVELSYDQFVIETPLLIDNGQTLTGQGDESTTLQMKAGANLDCVIKSTDFDTLTGSNTWLVSAGMQHGIRITNLRIDGNKANQTAGAGDGIRLFAKGSYIDNVMVWATRGRGIFWESGAIIGGPFSAIDEANQSVIGRLYVMNSGSHGLVLDTVSDAVIVDYTCGGTGGRGLWIIQSPADIVFAHVWDSQQEGIVADAQLRAGHLQTESNVLSGLVLNGVHSYVGMIFTQVPNNSQPQHIVINADNCVIGDAVLKGGSGAGPAVHIKGNNCRFSGKISDGTQATHIKLGTTGAPVNNCVVDATVKATAGRILAIEPGGVGNLVDVTANASGTATHWDGSHSATDTVRYLSSGAKSRNNGAVVMASAATTATVTHGLARTPALSEIQVTPLNNLGTATKYWISSPSSTTFTINADAAPGASLAKFSWRAELGKQEDALLTAVSDTFTDTDATALASHPADTGQAWTVHTGAFTIQTNTAKPSAATGNQIATLDAGISEGTFQLTVNLGTDPGGASGDHHLSLVYRYVDANNFYFARLRWDNVSNVVWVSLHRKLAGAFSQIVTQVQQGAINSDQVIEVVVSGTNHTLKLNGATIGSATASDLASATRIGIMAEANGYSPSTWSMDTLLAQV